MPSYARLNVRRLEDNLDGRDHGASEAAANGRRQPRGTVTAVALLAAPGVGILLPYIGPWMSMMAVAILVPRIGPRVWRAGWRRKPVVRLAIAALWLPALLPVAFFLLAALLGAPENIGTPEASGWLNALADVVETVGITF